MKKTALIMIMSALLASPVKLLALQQVCEMERVSLLRVPTPMAVTMPAGLKALNVAVDERGNMYASFSIWQAAPDGHGAISSPPHLIKYDATGKITRVLSMPSFLSEEAEVTSIAYRDGRIYATALWREGEARSGVLVFDSAGKLDRVIELDGFNAFKVCPGKEGVIYVLGNTRKDVGSDSPTIFKLSPLGKIMVSFSPIVGKTREEISRSLRSIMQNELLLDEASRVLHVLPDGEVRVFNSNGTLVKTFKKDGIGIVTSAFWDGKSIVMNRVDKGSRRAFRVSLDERVQLCETETTGQLPPMFTGADGYYYGVGHLGVQPDATTTQLEFLVAKFRMTQQ